jgi:peptide/nickel transport system permease protein
MSEAPGLINTDRDLPQSAPDLTVADLPGSRPVGSRPRRRPVALVLGVSIVLAWVIVAVLSTHLSPFDPAFQNPIIRFQAPGSVHWLGTDQFGRDTFSRMLAGAAPVLEVAPLATGLALIVGTAVGLSAATYGRWVDELIMRILDAALVFPAIIASILFVAMLGRSVTVLVLVIGISFVPIVARSVRAATLVERRKAYAEAAVLRSEPGWSLMVRELLPNVSRTVLVEATSRLGDAIFAAATLSFLGLGQPPGSPDWGASVSDNRAWLQNAPWTVLAPALAIASLVIGVALIADDLRARLDVR